MKWTETTHLSSWTGLLRSEMSFAKKNEPRKFWNEPNRMSRIISRRILCVFDKNETWLISDRTLTIFNWIKRQKWTGSIIPTACNTSHQKLIVTCKIFTWDNVMKTMTKIWWLHVKSLPVKCVHGNISWGKKMSILIITALEKLLTEENKFWHSN